MTTQLSSPKTVAIHTTLETPLQNLPTDCLNIISAYLPVKDRFLFERTYPKANWVPINKIAAAIKKSYVICDSETQTLIIKYAPFAKGPFKTTLESFITFQLSLLNNQCIDLFILLQQTPNTNEERARHTTQVTKRIQQNPILMLATDKHGHSPLHLTAQAGHIAIAQLLIANGGDLNVPITKGPFQGSTPLHVATIYGHTNVAQSLIDANADLNAINEDGKTPLHWTAILGHADIAQSLIEAKANLNAASQTGTTPLHGAAAKGHAEIATNLLANGANKDAKTNGGQTPLHFAVYFGHTTVAQCLIANRAKVTLKNNKGLSPLAIARAGGLKDIIRLLESASTRAGNDAHNKMSSFCVVM